MLKDIKGAFAHPTTRIKMGRTALGFLLLFALVLPALAVEASQPQVTKRKVYTQPPAGVDSSRVRVIKRVYRKLSPEEMKAKNQEEAEKPAAAEKWEPPVRPAKAAVQPEQNLTKSGYRYFVGAGFGLIQRDRTIVIDSVDSGESLDLGGRIVRADGTSYSVTQDESESAPELELGFYNGDWDYFGGKMTLYGDFVELSAFAGMRFFQVQLARFTPYLQGLAGIGYDGISGVMPDNLTLGLTVGGERRLSGDYLMMNIALSYQHRFWQKLEMSYGDEHWRDSEIALRAGLRYAF